MMTELKNTASLPSLAGTKDVQKQKQNLFSHEALVEALKHSSTQAAEGSQDIYEFLWIYCGLLRLYQIYVLTFI